VLRSNLARRSALRMRNTQSRRGPRSARRKSPRVDHTPTLETACGRPPASAWRVTGTEARSRGLGCEGLDGRCGCAQRMGASGFRVGRVHSGRPDGPPFEHPESTGGRPWSSVAASVGRAQPQLGPTLAAMGCKGRPWSARAEAEGSGRPKEGRASPSRQPMGAAYPHNLLKPQRKICRTTTASCNTGEPARERPSPESASERDVRERNDGKSAADVRVCGVGARRGNAHRATPTTRSIDPFV
jgi:hypothetical protein